MDTKMSFDGQDDYISRLEELSNPSTLISFLTRILNSPELCRINSEESESHRLGFDKIILDCSESNSYKLHLHIWWENSTIRDGIHNHKFNFVSKILRGGLTDNLYTRLVKDSSSEVESGDWVRDAHEYLAQPVNSHGTDKFIYRGVSRIKRYARILRKEDTMYVMHNQTFHASYPTNPDELTMTLFIKTANVKVSDTIFEKVPFESQQSDDVSIDNIRINIDKYRDILQRVIVMLSNV